MRCIAPLSFATLLFLFCTVEWIIGVPVPSNGTTNSTTEHQPSGDKPFPFREYQNESDEYEVMDDMIIRKGPSRAGMVEYAWPDGIVPYTFAYTIAPNQRPMILQAIKELSEISCIRFRPATRDDTYNIEFRNDPMSQGCSSFVGWQNRKNQPVQLSAVCSKGNAIHEILHALGFFHEQTRDDRDNYVTINFQNIQPGFENNFKKDSELYSNAETSYFGVAYNYDSIMHYGKTYFSKNQQNTIDVKEVAPGIAPPVGNPDNLGQRDFISQGDMEMLKAKYNCSGSAPIDENGSNTDIPIDNGNNNEEGETTVGTTKPTTKNPMCQYNPGLPMCKQ